MKVNILLNNDDNYKDYDIKLELKHLKELEEVQVLIDKLDFNDLLTANEFVKGDKSEVTCEIISDEEIIKAIHPETDDVKMINISLPKITYNEMIKSYDKVIIYLEQQEGDCDKLKFIKKLKKDALKLHFISIRQVNFDNFVTII